MTGPPDTPKDQLPIVTSASTSVPAVSATVAAGTTEVTVQIGDLLGIETVKDPDDRKILLAAWTFSPDPGDEGLELIHKQFHAEITRLAKQVQNIVEGYSRTGDAAPNIVDALYDHLELLQRQYHIAAAWEELKQPEPDLLKLLYCIRMAASNAASRPAAIGEEIDRLRAEIAVRELQSDTYDHMCQLSDLVAEALPHLADGKNVMTAKTTVPALTSGDTAYIAVALKLAPQLRADAGKKDGESQAELRVLADKIAGLAGQLHETIRQT